MSGHLLGFQIFSSAKSHSVICRIIPFRMADYAAFGWRFFQAHGLEKVWIISLKQLEAAQRRFAESGEALVRALGILLEGQEYLGPCGVRELHSQLSEIADAHGLVLPKTPEWLGRKLTALKGVIEAELQVVVIDRHGHEGKRWIALKRTPRSSGQETKTN